jgi:Uncharacterised conserved protein (DUF2228)
MSRSKDKHQAKLKEIYGVNFPDSLFWFHEFIIEQRDCQDPIDLNDLDLYPSGVLDLLLKFDDLDRVKFSGDPLLHYRYYRDVPEFFTCLYGDCDGQHWGMLLDEPAYGFRGVAMYWSNDGAEMTVYESLFDALIIECEESIEGYTEYLLYEDTEGDISYYRDKIDLYQKAKDRIEKFLGTNQLDRNEGRSIGLKTSTGLDIVLEDSFSPDRTEAIEMLKLGRELWYWNGKDRSTEAFNLMKRAYELLGRHELIRILDAHFHVRSRPSVDLLQH